jgi:hypothetical protein
MLRKPGHHPRIHSNALMGPRIPQGIYNHRTDLSSGFRRGLTLIREGERPQAGAHARVRELAMMTAAEPEARLVFRHNAV